MATATRLGALIERYDGFLLDAYGVLVHGGGAFAGAAEFLHALERAGKPWRLVSNDAAKTPERAAARYHGFGFPITPDHVLNAGLLLGDWFATRGLVGARCRVLGPPDSAELVRRAGGEVIDLRDPGFEVLVLCDEAGYPLLETLDDTLSCLVHAREQSRAVALVLPNPDLTYPRGEGQWGFASGALAAMLESGLAARLAGEPWRFEPLGKPHPGLFRRALGQLGTTRALMVGDQLATDVRGGRDAGLDTALATWGVTRWPTPSGDVLPTWVLSGF
jgi:ribonucleotide monophosphatase NagD (HAD superfamily)